MWIADKGCSECPIDCAIWPDRNWRYVNCDNASGRAISAFRVSLLALAVKLDRFADELPVERHPDFCLIETTSE